MLKEPRRHVRFLTDEEAVRLIEALPEHLVPVVQFALATGCRMTEILRLEWRRVDFDRRVSWLDPGTTKNGDGRGIPLNRDAVLALRSVQEQHNRWCFTYQGKTHGESRLGLETLFEACRNREISVPRLAPFLGKLARDEWHDPARADGASPEISPRAWK